VGRLRQQPDVLPSGRASWPTQRHEAQALLAKNQAPDVYAALGDRSLFSVLLWAAAAMARDANAWAVWK